MVNPNIAQGTLNRLRASVVWDDVPRLNVTAPYLGPEGIGLALRGNATTIIPTMTGTITSPEPFQMADIFLRLNRSQSLADMFKKQMEDSTLLGNATVRSDSTPLSPYPILNVAIVTVGELTFNGTSAGFGVQVTGYYPVNNSLFD